MQFLTEGEHLHSSNREYQEEFTRFSQQLGVSEFAESLNW
jgi:hypothetical protein